MELPLITCVLVQCMPAQPRQLLAQVLRLLASHLELLDLRPKCIKADAMALLMHVCPMQCVAGCTTHNTLAPQPTQVESPRAPGAPALYTLRMSSSRSFWRLRGSVILSTKAPSPPSAPGARQGQGQQDMVDGARGLHPPAHPDSNTKKSPWPARTVLCFFGLHRAVRAQQPNLRSSL